MAATVTKARLLGPRSLWVEFTSTLSSPTFYVYLDGVLVSKTQRANAVISIEPNIHYVLEVTDSASQTPTVIYPARWWINWQPSPDGGVHHYRVEEFVSSAWVLRAKVPHSGRSHYRWLSRQLEDVTTHQFRIVPVGTNGNQGTAATITSLMVRQPDIPSVVQSNYVQATRTITFNLAS